MASVSEWQRAQLGRLCEWVKVEIRYDVPIQIFRPNLSPIQAAGRREGILCHSTNGRPQSSCSI
jgi:hypothetical protein